MERALVVMGQGYVGLPLAQAASAAGHKVFGFDISTPLVNALNSGVSHVDDISNADLEKMLANGYQATAEASVIASADVVVICVPTPLRQDGGPDLRAVESAGRTIADYLTSSTTVVLESTTYPGTTEDLLLPLLEASGLVHGRDFFVAFSPERVNPGFPEFGIKNTPKLVGGLTQTATERACGFYGDFVDTVVPLKGAKEAETAKLLENTYRHVNIALVNEMARFCHDLDIDIWEVIRGAATKPFGFQKFTPGPGVGGHCIPIDPNYLSYEVKRSLGYPFKFVELAQEINNSMPRYVVERIADLLNDSGKPVRGTRVLLLGVTYKPDIADQRESPAVPVAKILEEKGAAIDFHDWFVEEWHLDGRSLSCVADLDKAVAGADIVVLLQQHRRYKIDKLASQSEIFFDTRGVTQDARSARL